MYEKDVLAILDAEPTQPSPGAENGQGEADDHRFYPERPELERAEGILNMELSSARLREAWNIVRDALLASRKPEGAPTQWAYDQACRALHKHEAEETKFRKALEEIIEAESYKTIHDTTEYFHGGQIARAALASAPLTLADGDGREKQV